MVRILLVVTVLLAAAVDAPAHDVTCGMTLTESITLTDDLVCIGTALTIGDPDAPPGPPYEITVDLGGHTVVSDCSAYGDDCATIRVLGKGLTLQNGRIVAAGTGHRAIHTYTFLQLEDALVDGGEVFPHAKVGQSVRNSTFVNGASVSCGDAGLLVENSHFVDWPVDRQAIYATFCGVSIRSNTFSGSGTAINLTFLWTGTNVIEDNVIDGGGITIENGAGNSFTNSLSRNYVASAPGHGITVIRSPTLKIGVSDNTVVGNGGDGISVLGEATGEVTLGANLAVANVDLGIEASGAIDGGGNSANLNGDPLQCVGVQCALTPACSNTIDDDRDGLADFPDDPGCTSGTDTNERRVGGPDCDDRVDDDGDGLADYPDDPGCRDAFGLNESPECQDGLDNDEQPGIDFDGGASVNGGVAIAEPDPECVGRPHRVVEAPSCGLGAEVVFLLPLLRWRRRFAAGA